MEGEIKDSNGAILKDGDTVIVTRTLKVKGANMDVKKGTVIKNIRLDEDYDDHVACRVNKSTIMLKTEFLRKKG